MSKLPHSTINQLHATASRWFAVRTGYKREKQVVKRLTRLGIEAYLPLMEVTRYYTRKKKVVQLPLFNCYVFVKVVQAEYVTILKDPDVIGFLKIAKDLIAIPDAEIDLLRRIVGEQMEVAVQPISFTIGDEVELIHGQLTGLKGKLIAEGNQQKFVVDLQHIGYSLYITVAAAHIRLLRRPMSIA